MVEFTQEMIEKAKLAKSAQELQELAKAENIDLSLEQATEYMKTLHPPMGEIEDDDLDNVAGGGCHKGDGRLIVTVGHSCKHWRCKKCGGSKIGESSWDNTSYTVSFHCSGCSEDDIECETCKFMSYEKAMWLCNHPANRK